MAHSRSTPNGRHITATPRLRAEPDMKGLVALVLHLAEQLHAAEQNNPGAGGSGANEEGPNDDTPDTSTTRE